MAAATACNTDSAIQQIYKNLDHHKSTLVAIDANILVLQGDISSANELFSVDIISLRTMIMRLHSRIDTLNDRLDSITLSNRDRCTTCIIL